MSEQLAALALVIADMRLQISEMAREIAGLREQLVKEHAGPVADGDQAKATVRD